ncbi:hypothetical protein [Acidimangrovimonas pyrenivorans]|uniref:PH domain-containing protein n=1 Tax=Acidimangrovimonas pyrenivorans TaxID=2030798 RepID=A0ABV7AME9_9RHOB
MSTPDGWEGILEPGEKILWQGRPDGNLHVPRIEPARLLFGLVFLGFALFWTFGAARSATGDGVMGVVFPALGLPFVVVGANMAGGSFLWQAYLRRHSWYTLTDRHAFVATSVLGRRSLRSWRIDPATIVDFEDGALGSVYFTGSRQAQDRRRGGFEYIAEAPRVLDLVRRVQRGQA